jgi:hypothetical protein
MVKLSDLRTDSWFKLLLSIKRGASPKIADLAAALRRGEGVPPEAQQYIASLLDGSASKRGRPVDDLHPEIRKALTKYKQNVDAASLVLTVTGLMDEMSDAPDPLNAALKELAKVRHVSEDTMGRYYKQAVRRYGAHSPKK